MSFREFSSNDVFKNTLITYPKFNFKIHAGNVYLNNDKDSFAKYINLNTKDVELLKGTFDFTSPDQSSLIILI